MKKNRIIIRAIWGDVVEKYPCIVKEAKKILSQECFYDNSLYLFLGQDNYDYFKDFSASKNLVLFDKRNFIHPEEFHHYWHKPYIIKKFLEEYKEVCFLDWDTILLKSFDEEEFWNLIHKKEDGAFNGEFQTALVEYARKLYIYWRHNDSKWLSLVGNPEYSIMASMNACLVYSRNVNVLDEWLNIFPEIDKVIKKHRGVKIADESAFNWYYEKRFPYSPIMKMFRDFASYAVTNRRSFNNFPEIAEKTKDAIFYHK